MNHPIDFFYAHAGKVLEPYMDTSNAVDGDLCAVCERDTSEWANPKLKVEFEAYGVKENHCLSCHSLYQGSIELFGVERLAKGTAVPMKLGMATGCGALITQSDVTLFLNGFIKKMSLAEKAPFAMVEMSGKKAHNFMIENTPEEDTYLYIGNFGRKKKDLVSNLKMSHGRTLFICEESGITEIMPRVIKDLRAASQGMKSTTVTKLRTALTDVYTGKKDADDKIVVAALENAASENSGIVAAVKNIPIDPHLALNNLRMWQQ